MLALPFSLRGRNDRSTIQAAYLFHESGDPLATVASENATAVEPEQLAPILKALRTFVETSEPTGPGFGQTSERFGDASFVAVRGRHLSACAVFRGNGEATLRKELVRFLREFEERNVGSLTTWERARLLADEASRGLSDFVNGPMPPRPPASHAGQGSGLDEPALAPRSADPVGEGGAASGPAPTGSA
jgi:hypothetical protein